MPKRCAGSYDRRPAQSYELEVEESRENIKKYQGILLQHFLKYFMINCVRRKEIKMRFVIFIK